MTADFGNFVAKNDETKQKMKDEMNPALKSLTSESTHSATQFFKQSYKISHPPGL